MSERGELRVFGRGSPRGPRPEDWQPEWSSQALTWACFLAFELLNRLIKDSSGWFICPLQGHDPGGCDPHWGPLMAPPMGTENRAICGQPGYCGFPAPTPSLLRAPPHPWVLRELTFLVPLIQAPDGLWQWVCMALRVVFSSCSGHPCCAHTSPHDIQGLPFSA